MLKTVCSKILKPSLCVVGTVSRSYAYVPLLSPRYKFQNFLIQLNDNQLDHHQNILPTNCTLQFSFLHTTFHYLKSKSKKSSAKIQEVIRPVDAAEVLDLLEVQNSMKALVDELKEDFAKDFRVGSDIAIDQLEISVDGDIYTLNELAQITKESPRLILVDMISFPEYLKVVEDSIRMSKWNLNPIVSGTSIKVPIPQATAERRATVAKAAKQRLTLCKNHLNKVAHQNNDVVAHHQKISEDFERIVRQQIQIYCDHFISQAEAMYKGKEHEILKPS